MFCRDPRAILSKYHNRNWKLCTSAYPDVAGTHKIEKRNTTQSLIPKILIGWNAYPPIPVSTPITKNVCCRNVRLLQNNSGSIETYVHPFCNKPKTGGVVVPDGDAKRKEATLWQRLGWRLLHRAFDRCRDEVRGFYHAEERGLTAARHTSTGATTHTARREAVVVRSFHLAMPRSMHN